MSRKQFYKFRPHPWHGISSGPNPPSQVTAYIEMTPYDHVKYESDKLTGYIRVDRPQRSSAQPPTLYGFIPRTLCASRVAALSGTGHEGDGDPLDVCVVSERPITRANIIMDVRVIGGLRMIDQDEVDDKIVAIFEKDNIYGTARDIDDLPHVLIERLVHYFNTYKWVPGKDSGVVIETPYGAEKACEIVQAARADYRAEFGG